MARAGMANLIDQVEDLLYDTANAFWSADSIQTALDRYRVDVHQQPMGYLATQSSTGANYLTFYYGRKLEERYGSWEETSSFFTIYGANFSTLTPATYDYATGLFTFATTQSPPLYVTGRTYDLYAAAWYCLNKKLASRASHYAFSAAGQTFNANQAFEMWLQLRKEYAGRMRARSVAMLREDFNPLSDRLPPDLPVLINGVPY